MRRRDHERVVGELRREIIFLQRQNDQLLDRLMYVTGQPWGLPQRPVEEKDEPMPDYVLSPETTIDALTGIE